MGHEAFANGEQREGLQQQPEHNQMAANGQKDQRTQDGEKLGYHGHIAQTRVNHVGHGQTHGARHSLTCQHNAGRRELHDHGHGKANEQLVENFLHPLGRDRVNFGNLQLHGQENGQHQADGDSNTHIDRTD